MKIGTSLLVLVGAATAPLIVFSIVMGYSTVDTAAAEARQGALDRARLFMTAVEAEIGGHVSTLAALAESESLAQDRLDVFRREAVRVRASQKLWQNITLRDAAGKLLISALPEDPQGRAPVDVESLREAVRTGQPVVGNVDFRKPPGEFGVAIRVPIMRDGAPRYVLSAIVSPNIFQELMVAQRLPSGWISGLIDANGHFVARLPPRPHTDFGSEIFRAQVAKAEEGWYRGLTVDNVDTFTAFRRSPQIGWSIGIAVPASHVHAPGVRAAGMLAGGILLTLMVGWSVAFILARYITRPAQALAEAARALGQHSRAPVFDGPIRIRELRDLAKALDEAGGILAERDRLVQSEQAALRAADQAKNQFLAMLGHELRNPLAAIATSSEILKRKREVKPGEYDPLQSIVRQTWQMSRLIEDLLNASRLSMGKMSLSLEVFDLADAVKQTAHSWEQSRSSRQGRLRVTTQRASIKADRLRTDQILANLLDNAEKFSPAGSPIWVTVDALGPEARLTVRDIGKGLEPDSLEKVFQLFVQDTMSPEYSGQGLGIGLALVRGFAELHGGKAHAESDGAGKGATFIVTFPREHDADSRVGSYRGYVTPSTPLRVLVVEDGDDGRRALQELLTLEGHEVHAAANGTAALAAIEAFTPEVALVDIGLPDMSGYDVAAGLRRKFGAGILIISLSGYGQSEDQQRAFAAGIDLYLTKPVDMDQLKEFMNKRAPKGAA